MSYFACGKRMFIYFIVSFQTHKAMRLAFNRLCLERFQGLIASTNSNQCGDVWLREEGAVHEIERKNFARLGNKG